MDKWQYLREIENVIKSGKYGDNWESLAKHPVPEWYKKSRLGFFIHWGVYSVPAYFTEWYPRMMYFKQNPVYWHHNKKYGKDFDYHEFIPMFKAEKFDAKCWIDALSACKADFVMPVAEHHDGFKMYKSGLSVWNAAEMGPKRDVLAEIKAACEADGIKFAASSHRAEHYWFMNGGRTVGRKNAVLDENLREFYGDAACVHKGGGLAAFFEFENNINPPEEWLCDWLVSSCEIVDKYLPAAFYFDSWAAHEAFRPYMRKFLAYYYNKAEEAGKEVVNFYKIDAALYGCGVYVRERGQIDGISPEIWQCETSTAYNAWSYCTTNKFKKPEEIICNMVDVWSKNGVMALNIGPKADGTICEEEQSILSVMRDWLEKNKEACEDTTVYRVFGEGKKQKAAAFSEKYKYTKKDFRFLYKLGEIFAFSLVPAGTVFRIKSLKNNMMGGMTVKSVQILGEDIKVEHNLTRNGLELRLEKEIRTNLPVCFKIEID